MPKRSEIPLEERQYGHFYLILAGLLAFTTLWAIWDMIYVRAPWQRYQTRLNDQEAAAVAANLETLENDLQETKGENLQRLGDQLAQAEADLEGDAYQALRSELAAAQVVIEDAMQEYRFAKSEYDALWYRYKHAEHEGHDDEMAALRPEVDDLNEIVVSLKQGWDDAEIKKSEIDKRLSDYRAKADNLQAQIDALMKPTREVEDRLARITDRKIAIEQFVLADFVKGNFQSYLDVVDRCTSCHVNADKGGYENYTAPFKTHPNRDVLLKLHPINRFGCTPCHEGQGEALQKEAAHGRVQFWEHPLLAGELIEAGCNKCHAGEMKIEHAPQITRAKRMVFDLGCYGCHDINGYADARKIGPPLNNITKKTTTEFIYRWISDTKSFREHTRMPNPKYTHDEAVAVTAYLNSISADGDYQLPPAPSGGSAARGERLVESIGCKGCHVITEEDRQVRITDVAHDVAPELTKIAGKANRDWLYAWILNPKQYHPETTMPSLRLTNAEARDIVAYLMTRIEANPPANRLDGIDLSSADLIAEGKASIRNFGCHGCHEIQGMENEGKVSVSLDEFGGKAHDELFFGDALAKGQVQDETWDDWAIGKMQNSRLYETEAVIQRMPNYAFSDEDAKSLAMLLKSWDSRRIGEAYINDVGRLGGAMEAGRRLVRQYNCVGCHIIEGEGGFIRPTIVEAYRRDGKTQDAALAAAPPDLIGEGRKVQPDWLFQFLKTPTTEIRPWLEVRMPTFDFSDDEANALIEYFQALEGMREPFSEIATTLTRAEQRAAEQLFRPDILSCFSCHQVGDKKPEGPPDGWAPDFLLAPERLNPDWVYDWIADPQALQPGTRMPAYYPDIAEALPNILGGDADRQVEALRDYLMNIHRFQDRL